MYVRMLEGRFAGEIKDLENATALEWIRQGKAKRPFDDPVPSAPAIGAAAPPAASLRIQEAEPLALSPVEPGRRRRSGR